MWEFVSRMKEEQNPIGGTHRLSQGEDHEGTGGTTPMREPPTYQFCPMCGTKLKLGNEHETTRPFCEACGFVVYYNPAPAVAALIQQDGFLLLVRRRYEPRPQMWSLPAGFMEFGETQVDGLRREILEETNIEILDASPLPAEDAFEDPRTHVVLLPFLVHSWRGITRAGDDADLVGWFSPDDLPTNMAWSSHVRLLEKALDRKQIGVSR
jgi:8-oxo-dGTP diphosphatase